MLYIQSAAAAKSLQLWSDSVRSHRRQPTRLPRPWDSLGKNTGVGCHFLLQCMKVKSESEVAQSCPTLRDHMDCSLPGSSVHGIFQARVLEWGAIAFSDIQSRQNQTQFQLEHVTNIECVYIRIEIPHFQTKKKEKENYALSEFNLLSTCPQIIVLRGTGVSLSRVKMRPHSIHDQLIKASEVLAGFFSRTQSDERAEIK